MGKSYMSKKWFDPGNKRNMEKIFIAQQKFNYEKKCQRELHEQYKCEEERISNLQLTGDEKARLGLYFMYNPPAGMEKQDEPQRQKCESGRPDKSLVIEVCNTSCIKCKKWGHVNTDKICPLYGKSRLDNDSTYPMTQITTRQAILKTNELTEDLHNNGMVMRRSCIEHLMHLGDPNGKDDINVDESIRADNREVTKTNLDSFKQLPKKTGHQFVKNLKRLQ